jgi:hypothetical protein
MIHTKRILAQAFAVLLIFSAIVAPALLQGVPGSHSTAGSVAPGPLGKRATAGPAPSVAGVAASAGVAEPFASQPITRGLLSLPVLESSTKSIGPHPPVNAVAIPWSQAVSIGQNASTGYDSMTWNVTGGEAVALSSPATLSASQAFANQVGCIQTWIVSSPSAVTVPATPASASVGTATVYLLSLTSPDAVTTTLNYFVIDGAVAYAYSEVCPYDTTYQQILPDQLPTIGSPAAVVQANLAGGGAYLASDPSALRVWLPIPQSPATDAVGTWINDPSQWEIEYAPSLASDGCGGFFAGVDGTTGAVISNYTESSIGCNVDFPVNFTETGLPADTNWTVSLEGTQNSSSTTSVGFAYPNGSWSYNVAAVAGYAPTPANGSALVTGTGINVTIAFVAQSTGIVSFLEGGLASGSGWEVILDNISISNATNDISFPATGGTHVYQVAPPGPLGNVTPSTGSVTITGGEHLFVDITFTSLMTYAVSFNETGLPAGLIWGVFGYSTESFYVQNLTNAATLAIELPNGSYAFFPGSTSADYYYAPGVFAFTVNGTGVNESVVFSQRDAYTVTFNETGLAPGTAWVVLYEYQFNSTTGTSVQFTMINSTFSFAAGGAPGYVPSPTGGTITVSGGPANQTIVFTHVRLPGTFTTTFTETGLPGGTDWSVTLSGTLRSSNSNAINFTELNGTYDFTVSGVAGYAPTPSSGVVDVNGANLTKSISYAASSMAKYSVTFNENGLPTGTAWTVTLAGTPGTSETSSIAFSEPNGTYNFTVSAVNGLTSSPTTSSIKVDGAPAAQAVQFSPSAGTYAIVFAEAGLSTGLNWSLTFNGVTRSTTTGTISFDAQNGTYAYSVGGVPGYTSSPSSGSLTVGGHDLSESIQFSASNSTGHPASFLGLPGDDGYLILGILAVVVVVGVALVLIRGGRSPGGGQPSSTPPPGSVDPSPPPGTNPP